MKRYRHISLVLLTFMGTSCVRSIIPSRDSGEDKITTYDEDLSVIRPRYEPRAAPAKPASGPGTRPSRPATGTNSGSTVAPVGTINRDVDAAVTKMADRNKAITTTQGYRILVFSGNSKTEYEQARSYLLQYFPNHDSYVSYSQPTYRIKMGDFLTRDDAETVASELRSRFVATKVIVDNVDYKKGLQYKYLSN